MKFEHLNFIIQNYENSATTTYFQLIQYLYHSYLSSVYWVEAWTDKKSINIWLKKKNKQKNQKKNHIIWSYVQ